MPNAQAPDGHRVILLRHGQSTYNAANVFTGWDDPPLTHLGMQESTRAGELIAAAGLEPTTVHTSLLLRAILTARLAQAAAHCADAPVRRSWRLNGRHYGALQGHDKDLIRREFGAELAEEWRRSYRARPPDLRNDPNLTGPKYAHVPLALLSHAESLRDVLARVLPCWFESIVPDLRDGGTVLVVAHGNTAYADQAARPGSQGRGAPPRGSDRAPDPLPARRRHAAADSRRVPTGRALGRSAAGSSRRGGAGSAPAG